jgi:hypothetical protein
MLEMYPKRVISMFKGCVAIMLVICGVWLDQSDPQPYSESGNERVLYVFPTASHLNREIH